jgi:hypothetical protein
MTIRIIKEKHDEEAVDFHSIVQIIETNRDRVRATGNMILTVSGIILSAIFAFLLFLFNKGGQGQMERILLILFFGGAICINLVSIYFAITSSFLITKYPITTRINMINDLLLLFHSELRLVRISFICLILGLLLLAIGIFIFVFSSDVNCKNLIVPERVFFETLRLN